MEQLMPEQLMPDTEQHTSDDSEHSESPPRRETSQPAAPAFDVVIEAGRSERQYWRDVLRYWELLLILAWRDVAVRYKQTIIGIAWVVVRPISTVVVLSVVFGQLAGLPSESVPYPLLVMAAMLAWQLFSNSLTSCVGGLVGNANLVTKVYFPRVLIPLSFLIGNLVDFAVTAVLFGGMMVWYGQLPEWPIVFLPAFLLLCLACTAGIGLWLSALNVRYRDVQHIVPFIVQFGLYITPIGYSTSVVPEDWRLWFALNPLVGIVDGFRWSLLGTGQEPFWPGVLLSVVISMFLLVSGISYFRRTERTFADLI
jgi:lipopolysaccharide transport system permease protein